MPIVATFLIDTCRNIDENKICQALVILRSWSNHANTLDDVENVEQELSVTT